MERKIFWTSFILFSLIADFSLQLLWGAQATIPIALVSWWIAYRSGWFLRATHGRDCRTTITACV